MAGREDLRQARAHGLYLLRVRGLDGGARIDGSVLRYDPELDDCARAAVVFSLLAERSDVGFRPSSVSYLTGIGD